MFFQEGLIGKAAGPGIENSPMDRFWYNTPQGLDQGSSSGCQVEIDRASGIPLGDSNPILFYPVRKPSQGFKPF